MAFELLVRQFLDAGAGKSAGQEQDDRERGVVPSKHSLSEPAVKVLCIPVAVLSAEQSYGVEARADVLAQREPQISRRWEQPAATASEFRLEQVRRPRVVAEAPARQPEAEQWAQPELAESVSEAPESPPWLPAESPQPAAPVEQELLQRALAVSPPPAQVELVERVAREVQAAPAHAACVLRRAHRQALKYGTDRSWS